MKTQLDLWGNKIVLEPIEDVVADILERHPETRGSDKELILKVWETDGLGKVLGDDGLLDRFRQWFLTQATYTETITRARRACQKRGIGVPDERDRARRALRQGQWRNTFRRGV
jgi:hypothetical protein